MPVPQVSLVLFLSFSISLIIRPPLLAFHEPPCHVQPFSIRSPWYFQVSIDPLPSFRFVVLHVCCVILTIGLSVPIVTKMKTPSHSSTSDCFGRTHHVCDEYLTEQKQPNLLGHNFCNNNKLCLKTVQKLLKFYHGHETTHHIMMSLSPVWHIAGPLPLAARLNGIEHLLMYKYRQHKMNISIKRQCTPEDLSTIPRYTGLLVYLHTVLLYNPI